MMSEGMNPIEMAMGFVHIATQRTGYATDGPFCEYDKSGSRGPDGRWPVIDTLWTCKWDDTGEEGEVMGSEIKWVKWHQRHITDGKRPCHCRPYEIDGIVIHRGSEEQN
jgi:hypothetical protein